MTFYVARCYENCFFTELKSKSKNFLCFARGPLCTPGQPPYVPTSSYTTVMAKHISTRLRRRDLISTYECIHVSITPATRVTLAIRTALGDQGTNTQCIQACKVEHLHVESMSGHSRHLYLSGPHVHSIWCEYYPCKTLDRPQVPGVRRDVDICSHV